MIHSFRIRYLFIHNRREKRFNFVKNNEESYEFFSHFCQYCHLIYHACREKTILITLRMYNVNVSSFNNRKSRYTYISASELKVIILGVAQYSRDTFCRYKSFTPRWWNKIFTFSYLNAD